MRTHPRDPEFVTAHSGIGSLHTRPPDNTLRACHGTHIVCSQRGVVHAAMLLTTLCIRKVGDMQRCCKDAEHTCSCLRRLEGPSCGWRRLWEFRVSDCEPHRIAHLQLLEALRGVVARLAWRLHAPRLQRLPVQRVKPLVALDVRCLSRQHAQPPRWLALQQARDQVLAVSAEGLIQALMQTRRQQSRRCAAVPLLQQRDQIQGRGHGFVSY